MSSRFTRDVPFGKRDDLGRQLVERVADTAAMGEAIEVLERWSESHMANDSREVSKRIDHLTSLYSALHERLDALEHAKAKAEPVAEGEYVVRWRAGQHREIGWLCGGNWFEDLGLTEEGVTDWCRRVEEPHEIGPRIDNLK